MADAAPRILERLAHDLRGPLSPLQTAAYLLRREDVDDDRRGELLDIIDRQTTRLSNMLQEVSDWNRARQGRLVAHREVSALEMVLELACASPASTAPGGAIDMQLPPSLQDCVIDGDAQRLVQMFGSLIAHALAASPQVRIEGRPASEGEVLVSIRGRGAESSETDANANLGKLLTLPEPAPFDEGLGLRLLIAESIARAHGGGIDVANTDGGVEFRVWLPTTGDGNESGT